MHSFRLFVQFLLLCSRKCSKIYFPFSHTHHEYTWQTDTYTLACYSLFHSKSKKKFLCRQSVLYVDKYTIYFVIVVAIETVSLSQINTICPTVPFVCMQSSDCDFSLTLAFTTLHAMKSTQSVRMRRLSVFFHCNVRWKHSFFSYSDIFTWILEPLTGRKKLKCFFETTTVMKCVWIRLKIVYSF